MNKTKKRKTFLCVKDCYLLYSTGKRVFEEGKEYHSVLSDCKEDYCVLDDENKNHWINQPGDEFFDEHFIVKGGRKEEK